MFFIMENFPVFNLIEEHKKDEILLIKIKELNLLQTHPKFKVGQSIKFISGYESNLYYITKITGFDKDGGIYVLWDCFWFPIQDDEKRQITIIA